MRYQRVKYRYALGVTTGEQRQPGEIWRVTQVGVQLAETRWRPAADIYESAEAVTAIVELAGVDPDALDVRLYEDAVVVQGRRRLPTMDPNGRYLTAQIRQGPFLLVLPLPLPIDGERVAVSYEGGLLRLTLPKADGR